MKMTTAQVLDRIGEIQGDLVHASNMTPLDQWDMGQEGQHGIDTWDSRELGEMRAQGGVMDPVIQIEELLATMRDRSVRPVTYGDALTFVQSHPEIEGWVATVFTQDSTGCACLWMRRRENGRVEVREGDYRTGDPIGESTQFLVRPA